MQPPAPSCAALREEFKAALIDEFQDTDPVQYAIFWDLFSAEKSRPNTRWSLWATKQAIYAFRGGDITPIIRPSRALGSAPAYAEYNYARNESGRGVNEVFWMRRTPIHFERQRALSAPLGANDVQAAVNCS